MTRHAKAVWRLAWGCGLILLLATGCGHNGPGRHDVSGRVYYKGAPLPAGEIFFDPDVRRGNNGPMGYALIKDGDYDTRRHGKPAVAGPHVARIQGFDGKPGQELPQGKPLFTGYEKPIDLPPEASTQDFDIP